MADKPVKSRPKPDRQLSHGVRKRKTLRVKRAWMAWAGQGGHKVGK